MVHFLDINLLSKMFYTTCHRCSCLFMTDIIHVNYKIHVCINLLQKTKTSLQFIGTTNKQDRKIRAQLYFMMSIEGSVQSQMVGCESF